MHMNRASASARYSANLWSGQKCSYSSECGGIWVTYLQIVYSASGCSISSGFGTWCCDFLWAAMAASSKASARSS